jgi:hypothetical protein
MLTVLLQLFHPLQLLPFQRHGSQQQQQQGWQQSQQSQQRVTVLPSCV